MTHASVPMLTAISSMATRAVLTELLEDLERRGGPQVRLESVGGVDAARRIQAGECFDLVFLAADAIDTLQAAGRLRPAGRVDLMRSSVAVAVPAGAHRPDIGTGEALRAAVLAAPMLGYSTGPSGTALLQLFERWGLSDALLPKLRQAPAGVPVARMLARGEVSLGFQQRSELLGAPGIDVLGDLPGDTSITTIFSAGVGAHSPQADRAAALLATLNTADADAIKRRHGMAPA